mmetsp:Transcript_40983/g.99356  ORF Transcript_40983/g.99356 Transcript_40983/m.99356 type:complete len:97 (+) Transcript_40983:1261-1551(+)
MRPRTLSLKCQRLLAAAIDDSMDTTIYVRGSIWAGEGPPRNTGSQEQAVLLGNDTDVLMRVPAMSLSIAATRSQNAWMEQWTVVEVRMGFLAALIV